MFHFFGLNQIVIYIFFGLNLFIPPLYGARPRRGGGATAITNYKKSHLNNRKSDLINSNLTEFTELQSPKVEGTCRHKSSNKNINL